MIPHRHIRHFGARYHRNGVAGIGFYACSFKWLDEGKLRPMTAVLFEEPGYCAVLDQTLNLTTVANRWRGDDFEPALRATLAAFDKADPTALFK